MPVIAYRQSTGGLVFFIPIIFPGIIWELLRVASSAQHISVLPEYVCLPSINSSLSELLQSVACFTLDLFFWLPGIFGSYFVVLLVLWCSRTRYAGISLA